MIFKPFVVLASAFATIQAANGANLAQRADLQQLCCAGSIPPQIPLEVEDLLVAALENVGSSLNYGLTIAIFCSVHEFGTTCAPGTIALSCEVAVPVEPFGTVGANCF
ncbi:hypothetical protein R3P38DRAFT_3262288 [Favolaschia claudopus]|uniref:Hydrophobin n=1 Tax=Favolaschia claudopus TaxID=2862362 RepID=A0AAW0CLQ3_9AGAR